MTGLKIPEATPSSNFGNDIGPPGMEKGASQQLLSRTCNIGGLAACRASSSMLLNKMAAPFWRSLEGPIDSRVFCPAVIEGVNFFDPEAIFCPGTGPAECFRPL